MQVTFIFTITSRTAVDDQGDLTPLMSLLNRSNHFSDLNQCINVSLSYFHHFPQIPIIKC
jgi:hypothetical protein